MTETSNQSTSLSTQEKFKQDLAWYLTLLLIVLVTCTPGPLCSLFYLSRVPDVTWQRGRENLTVDRIWMARLRRGPIGVGYETQRITQTFSETDLCVTTTIRYFLWSDAGDDTTGTTYHLRYTKIGPNWQPTGASC